MLLKVITFMSFVKLVHSLNCLDEDDNFVDWFVLYKIPHQKHNENDIIKSGLGYTFISSNNIMSNWTLSSLSMNDTNSIIGRTLKPLYEKKNDEILYVLYNDEPPNRQQKSNKGHTKGVVLGNKEGGVWLVHSVPHFPPHPFERYSYPNTGTPFGQSFLCLSLNLKNLNKVGIQLQYNEPEIYAQNIPTSLEDNLPNLKAASLNVTVKNSPWFHETQILTKNGTSFMSFAKSKHFGKDLYEDWLAPALKSNLLVETWLNGQGKMSSNCSKIYQVKNIESIAVDVAEAKFKTTSDHSKWAITNSSINIVCIGDINRMEHQKFRGGGTICLNNTRITVAYKSIIKSTENCKLSPK